MTTLDTGTNELLCDLDDGVGDRHPEQARQAQRPRRHPDARVARHTPHPGRTTRVAEPLVITGAGRAFCAGGDVSGMGCGGTRPADAREAFP